MGGGIEKEGNKMMHRKERKKRRNGQRRRETDGSREIYRGKKAHSIRESGGTQT